MNTVHDVEPMTWVGVVLACCYAWAAFAFGCQTPDILKAPTPAHGCRQDEVACLDGATPETLRFTGCCGEQRVCGGQYPPNVGCPPGECCDSSIGDVFESRRGRPPEPQRVPR